ncbi:hypothetical protein D3C80_2073720 [compost metagenome]
MRIEVTPAGDGSYDVSVTANGLALHVMIEADVAGRYSDNAFDLTSGETKVVRFTPKTPLAEGTLPRFAAFDLESCQGKG